MEISALKELQKLHKEFTRCTICFDVYRQPKMLPCLHTFCFQCLENYRIECSPLPITCPLCRSDAPQTTEGIQALPTNFLIVRLIDTKSVTEECDSGEGRFVPCDSCQEGENSDDAAAAPSPAVMFCVDCTEKLCESCVAMHRKMKLSKGHTLVPLDADNTETQLSQLMKSKAVMCEVHAEERIDFFCLTCETAICMKCCMLSHKTHDYKDIAEVSAMFKTGLSSIIESVSANIAKFQASSVKLEKQRKRLDERATKVEDAVEERMKLLLAEIEQHMASVLEAMKEYKDDKIEEMEDLCEDNQERLEKLETFLEFCQQLKDKGTNYEITKLSSQFVGRHRALQDMSSAAESAGVDIDLNFKPGAVAVSLTQSVAFLFGQLGIKSKEAATDAQGGQTQPKRTRNPRKPRPNVAPTAPGYAGQPPPPKGPRNKQPRQGSAKNPQKPEFFGGGFPRTCSSESADSMKGNHPPKAPGGGVQGDCKVGKGKNPQFSANVLSITGGINKPIQGIAVLGFKLLVARSDTPFIEIFDMSNNEINAEARKQQHINGMTSAFDMVADPGNDAVYVSETISSRVYRVGFRKNGSCQVGQFSTSGKPFGLSVNYAHNVLIACPLEKQVQEYSGNGDLVRVISTFTHRPRHVIELSHNQFIMLSEDQDKFIVLSKFIVDANGKTEIQKQYGGEKTPPKYRLNETTHLALESRYSVVLLANCYNNHVTAFRTDTLYACGNVAWKKQAANPNRLCLDQFGCMYVGLVDGLFMKYTLNECSGLVEGEK